MEKTKLDKNALNKRNFDQKATQLLHATIPKIKTAVQAEAAIRDLMSSSEIKDLARRLMAVKCLYQGSNYYQINLVSGMSMSTINKMHFKTRGSKVLPDFLK